MNSKYRILTLVPAMALSIGLASRPSPRTLAPALPYQPAPRCIERANTLKGQ